MAGWSRCIGGRAEVASSENHRNVLCGGSFRTFSATSPKCPTGADEGSPANGKSASPALSQPASQPPQPAIRRQPAAASRNPAPGRRYLTRYFASVAFSFSISIGLDRWSFMPDSLARATSSMKALAVMAMMGTSAASGLSHRRMARVAS